MFGINDDKTKKKLADAIAAIKALGQNVPWSPFLIISQGPDVRGRLRVLCPTWTDDEVERLTTAIRDLSVRTPFTVETCLEFAERWYLEDVDQTLILLEKRLELFWAVSSNKREDG